MKIRTSLLLISLIPLMGCSSARVYFLDRGNDIADVMSVAVGAGMGAKARVGPFQSGLLIQSDLAGLRGGTFFCDENFDSVGEILFPIPLIPVISWSSGGAPFMSGSESFCPQKTFPRQKAFSSTSVFLISISDGRPCPPYYTQIEAVVALGPSVRVGFNPGELLDLLLGWFSIDIYGDDIGKKWLNRDRESPPTLGGASKPF